MVKRKQTMGRQKIQIKRIDKEEARQVTFSKRRMGIFKKAFELSILCQAELAVVVFSPAGKPFSFGHPSVDAIFNRFHPERPPNGIVKEANSFVNASNGAVNLMELRMECENLEKQVEQQAQLQSQAGQLLKQQIESEPWQLWNRPINELDLTDLETYASMLQDLSAKLAVRSQHLYMYSIEASAIAGSGALVPYDHHQGDGSGGFVDITAYHGGLVPFDGAVVGDVLDFDMVLYNYQMQLPPPHLPPMGAAPLSDDFEYGGDDQFVTVHEEFLPSIWNSS